MTTQAITAPSVFTNEELLAHWQGHRRLTRRVIEAFPETELFTFSVGGMRPFAELALEMYNMTNPGIDGIVTGKWLPYGQQETASLPKTKEALLLMWDEATEKLNRLWAQVRPERFHEVDKAFGQWEGTIQFLIFYFIDNEIHHRAQGYVYLRALGIEPPPFWDRA